MEVMRLRRSIKLMALSQGAWWQNCLTPELRDALHAAGELLRSELLA